MRQEKNCKKLNMFSFEIFCDLSPIQFTPTRQDKTVLSCPCRCRELGIKLMNVNRDYNNINRESIAGASTTIQDYAQIERIKILGGIFGELRGLWKV